MEFNFKRTRLAPTPSGYLHLGNIYSFILTLHIAKKAGAKVLLRIDDLDRERLHDEYLADIFESLNYLNVKWDEGPQGTHNFKEWSQSSRMHKYEDMLKELKEGQLLFACTCSRKQLAEGKNCECERKKIDLGEKDCCWRLRTDKIIELNVRTLQRPQKAELPISMENLIVRRKDG